MFTTIRNGIAVGLLALPLGAQNLAPVINPRGVINAYSQQPAPSQVAAGGLIWINGLNLGPVSGITADGPTWPTELGDVQVLINNRPSPIYSVEPARIVVQVPLETPAGTIQVVVRRGTVNSRPARINVINLLPVVKTVENKGYGELAATVSGREFSFKASGLGVSDPRVNTGDAGPADPPARPRAAVDVHVGGLPVEADVRASDKTPGEFDIKVTLPESALPGDLITVEANNRLANFAAFQRLNRPEVTFVPMPEGMPDVRAIAASDLRGGFFLASAARADDGCWPSVLFDLRVRKATRVGQCLTTLNRNSLTPGVATQNGSSLAAFVGPPVSDQAVSSKVMVFSPSKEAALNVELPSAGVALLGTAANGFGALLSGTPPQLATIDSNTGQVEVGAGAAALPGLGGGGGGAGAGAGGAGAAGGALNPLTLRVDLGGGLTKILTAPVNIAQGQFAVVVGDDENDPKAAKLAILNQQGEVTSQREFASGWLPIVSPNAPQQPVNPGGGGGGGGLPGGLPGGPGGLPGGLPGGPGGLPGGLPGGPGGGIVPGGGDGGGVIIAQVRFRVTAYNDAQTRTYYVLARKADDSAHALMAFGPNDVKAIATPAKSFVATCTPTLQVLNVETARRIVMLGGNSPARDYQRVCGALSFLVFDLGSQEFTNIELPGAGEVNATDRADDLNDFLLATNTAGDTVFVLDGVTLTSYRLNLPQGVVGFANLQTLPAMEMAIATGRARQQNGDGGFLIFDIANLEVRQLLLPDGFANAQLVGILSATRKLVARGNKTGGTGSQFLIYDLMTGDIEFVDNPAGVAFVGNIPAAAQPGVQQAPAMQRVNSKSNTIEAVTFGADRRPNGAMLVRVH